MGTQEIPVAVVASVPDWEHFCHKWNIFSVSARGHPQYLAGILNALLFLTSLQSPDVQNVMIVEPAVYNWLGLSLFFLRLDCTLGVFPDIDTTSEEERSQSPVCSNPWLDMSVS